MAVILPKLLILYVLVSFSVINASKLNVPRVLLPLFEDFATNFTLEATESGCYKWSTTRPDLISLVPLDVDPDTGCASRTVISAITKDRTRNLAVVLAEDIHTRQVLRCDVIVDVINSLVITTTTKELFMEAAPEAFEVRAYDDQGNEFTSLEGVEFHWTIMCNGPDKDLTLLRFITFRDSPYETPDTVMLLEEQNKRGHIVLLEGIKTGSARVIVKLPFVDYQKLAPCEVNLTIVANLIMYPTDVYMMVGDIIDFKILHIHNGRMDEIKFEDAQYYLDIEEVIVASSDKTTGTVTALKEGKTRVFLHDKNIGEFDPPLKMPSATIHVVNPAYMVLNILPHKNWVVLVGDRHDLVAEVYTSTDHKMHLGPGVEVHTQVGEEFHVEERSQNGSWLTGWGVKEGMAEVQATLMTVVNEKFGKFVLPEALTAQKKILIYPSIVLKPSEVILPWDPHLKPKYEIDIEATGGDGKFLWTSSNHSMGVVTQTGHVRTHSHGFFEVSAAMTRNHHNRQTAKFLILPPTRLEIVEFVMEAEVGSAINLQIALYAESPGKGDKHGAQIPITNCRDLPFKVRSSDAKFIHNKTALQVPVGIACASVAVVGLAVGSSRITVTYFHEGNAFEDSVTVSAFKPLRLIHPKSCEVILPVGTSVNFVYTGGPKLQPGRSGDYTRNVNSSNSEIVEATDMTDMHLIPPEYDYTVVLVLCRKLGESSVELIVTNQPIVLEYKDTETTVTVKVICSKPRHIFLQPEIKVADVDACPMDISARRVVVKSSQDIELDVTVRDDQGRRFLSIESLRLEWTWTPTWMAELGSYDSVFLRNRTEGTVVFANRSYQTVVPKVELGVIDVNVKVAGYRQTVLSRNRVVPEWPEFIDDTDKDREIPPIVAVISLYLVDDTVVTPNVTAVYNHPGNKKILNVKQGSGYYDLALSNDDVADVKYVELSREIEIVPLRDGELMVHLIDLCLVSPPVFIKVTVVSIGNLRLEMSDKVEINRCITCIVRMYDEDDNILNIPELGMVDLKPSLENDIVDIQRMHEDPEKPWPLGEVHYIITGLELGDTKLIFTIPSGEGEVSSAPMDLQVFPPLRLYPRNGTIIVGAVFQISSKGGPQPESTLEYSTSLPKVADMDSVGLAKGLSIGHTKISAKSVGINPTTGKKVLYSQDEVDLNVIPLSGVKIGAPLSRFKNGATVPIWASGIPEQLSPMILGSVNDPIKFDWSVDDSEVVSIQGIFHNVGIQYEPQDQVSMRLTGLSAGRTKVNLVVTMDPSAIGSYGNEKVTFTTSLDVEVFEELELLTPYGISGRPVLMAPLSSIQLQTNLDSVSKLRYTMPGDDSSNEIATQSVVYPNPVVSVSSTGLLKSYGVFGHAMVIITAIDEMGLKQTLGIIVEVKPIHYMMVNVVMNWHLITEGNRINRVIPQGTEFELRATYHDNTGAVFSAGTSELKVRTTRFDLVRVRHGFDNSTATVSIKKSGYTPMKVWSEGYHKTADYIKLHVGQSIKPAVGHLTSGDIICLWTPVQKSNNEKGRWLSSDRGLVSIDQKTGIGRVLGIHGGMVSITHSLHPASPLQIQVRPISKVKMLPQPRMILTNNLEQSPFEVPLVLLSVSCQRKTNNLFGGEKCVNELPSVPLNFPFKCYVMFLNESVSFDPDVVFKLESGFNYKTGQYVCKLHSGHKNNPEISTINSNISVWAVVDATGVEAIPAEIHFRPALFLPDSIIVEDVSYKAELVIHGLDKILDGVSVVAYDPGLIHVDDAERPEMNVLLYTITLIDYHYKFDELGEAMNLEVKSNLTNERIKVRVKTHTSGDKFKRPICEPNKGFFHTYRHVMALLFAMLLIFVASYYTYVNMIQPSISINVSPNHSLLTPVSGLNRSRSGNQQMLLTSQMVQTQQCAALRRAMEQQQQHNCPASQQSIVPSNANRYDCFCGNTSQDPIYGNSSTFYNTSPELRRSRREF